MSFGWRFRNPFGTGLPSGWDPLDLGSTVKLWANARDAADYTLVSGNLQTLVNKASGSTFAAPASGNRPAYNATAINSHPAFVADGTDDRLVSSEAAVVAALNGGHAYTVCFVGYTTTPDANRGALGVGNSGVATNRTIRFGTSTASLGRYTLSWVNDAGGAADVSRGSDANTSPHIVMYMGDGSGSGSHHYIRVDGEATPSPNGTVSVQGTLTPNQVGLFCRPDSSPDGHWGGGIGEWFVADTMLSTGNQNLLFTYLSLAWDIALV